MAVEDLYRAPVMTYSFINAVFFAPDAYRAMRVLQYATIKLSVRLFVRHADALSPYDWVP